MERQWLDDRRRELVDLRPVVDGVVRLPENEVGKVLEGSPHLDIVILGTSFERHQAPRQRRVGCRLEDHRHLRHRARHLAKHGRHSGGKRTGLEDKIAAEVRAGRIDEHRISIAARHHDLLTGLRIPIDPRDRERQRRRHRLEFDAVDEIGASAAEVIGDTDDVLPVLRHLEPEVGIGPPGIVVSGDPCAIGPENVDDRIETAADPPRETFDLEHLPLGRREPEAVDITVGADDAIEGKRRFAGGRLSRGVVRLDLEEVAERSDPERDRGGADPVGVLGEEGENGSRRRHGHLLHDRSGGIAEECHRHRFPRLAPRRVDGRRPREGADMETVAAVAVAGITRLPNLHVVRSLLGGNEAEHAILLRHRRIIRRRHFEPLRVEDRHRRIEEIAPQPECLDIDSEPLPLGELHRVEIDILVLHHAMDGDVEVEGLRLLERAVGLLFVGDRQGTDADGTKVRDPRLATDLEQLLPERVVVGNEDRGLDRVVVDRRDRADRQRRRHRKPDRRVEENLFCILEPCPLERQFALAAPLHPAWQDDAQLRIGRDRHVRRRSGAHRRQHRHHQSPHRQPGPTGMRHRFPGGTRSAAAPGVRAARGRFNHGALSRRHWSMRRPPKHSARTPGVGR